MNPSVTWISLGSIIVFKEEIGIENIIDFLLLFERKGKLEKLGRSFYMVVQKEFWSGLVLVDRRLSYR